MVEGKTTGRRKARSLDPEEITLHTTTPKDFQYQYSSSCSTHALAPIPTRYRLPDAGPTGGAGEFHRARLSCNPKGDLGREADLVCTKVGGKRERQWSTACSLLKVLYWASVSLKGFIAPCPQPTLIHQDDEGSLTFQEQVCLLPIAMPQQCVFAPAPQRPDSDEWQAVILIGINGCYKLSLPDLNCSGCLRHWRVGLDKLVKSGYWPATMTYQTIFTVDLFKSFEDIKVLAPRCSRHAFVGMLDERTKHFGRSGKICGGTFQKPFL
eukprot:XP_014071216.1 PREDICTED: uncharacterized protein LOC106613464 [Salmo salar]